MSENLINNLPLISIITPISIAFIIGLFKNKYMKLKKALVILALSISCISVLLMINPVLLKDNIITVWLGNWNAIVG